VGELASAAGLHDSEAALIADLQAGDEQAYAWLIAQYHKPVYSLISRILDDPGDAPDATQEVFLKIFRGIRSFNGQSSLKTWIYRIALHEASNRRRWFFRHKAQELSIETPAEDQGEDAMNGSVRDMLVDEGSTPLEMVLSGEERGQVEMALRKLSDPYRTAILLRDIEELSYDQIAEAMNCSLGTVKSRIVRGRQALRVLLRESMPPQGGAEAEASSRRTARRGGANPTGSEAK